MTVDRGASEDVLLSQFKTYVDVYCHHFDLYLKATALYLAAVSAMATYMFTGIGVTMKVALSLLVIVTSLGAVAAGYVSKRWVSNVEEIVTALTVELSIDQFPFSGARGIIHVVMAISGALCIAGLINAISTLI